MLRSYRCILLAFVGWLSLAAANPKDAAKQPDRSAQSEVSASLNSIAAALQDANKPSEHDKPCENGGNDRSSDLCAQWKAADAADSSAQATWLFGYVDTLIGLLTLAAAGAAAWYAKKAAEHTETGAKAAVGSLEANRAWLTFKSVETPLVTDSVVNGNEIKESMGFQIKAVNSGATPALNATISWNMYTVPIDRDAYTIKNTIGMPPHMTAMVGPGQEFSSGLMIIASDDEYRDFVSQKLKAVIEVAVFYCDIYSAESDPPVVHRTEQIFVVTYSGRRMFKDGTEDITCQATVPQSYAD